MGDEAAKLTHIRSANLPAALIDGVPFRMLLAYRRRVGAEELHELRRHPDPIRLTLLAAFCHVRGREIADTLTELLITTVHRVEPRGSPDMVERDRMGVAAQDSAREARGMATEY